MTNKNYDSEFCGSLPLHQINLIQSYGSLLVVTKDDLRIIQASENAADIFNRAIENIIGLNLKDYLKKEDIQSLEVKFNLDITDKIPLTFTFRVNDQDKEYNALVHSKSKFLIIELEKWQARRSFIDVFQEFRFIMAEVNSCKTTVQMAEVVVRSLKVLAGFDRVLMYQFDEDWNGTVIAEAREDNMEAYLGLKFPASDIPKQARALYLKNPYRLIPDREYQPVRLYPVINPSTNTFFDLSDCNLRSVASVHLEYMENMGIKASMSIRVLRDGKLWGLISCHHRESRYISYEMCSVFELLSEVISSKVGSILSKEEFERRAELQSRQSMLTDQVYNSHSLSDGLFNGPGTISNMLNATGAALILNGNIESTGEVPTEDDLKDLVYWLQNKNSNKVFADSCLAKSYDQALQYQDRASGILSIPINAGKGDFVILFRPEVIRTINWGGNPEEAISFEPDGKKYHPRNSFNLWKQTLKQQSLPWTKDELEIADGFRNFIFEYSSKILG